MEINRVSYTLLVLLLLCFSAVCVGGSEQPQDDAVGIVLDILKSGDQEMQSVAIAMVRDLKGPEVTKALAKELPNLSATSQVQLLSAFGDRGDSAALPVIIDVLKSPNQSVRIAALKAVGLLGDKSCVGLLAKVAADTKGQEQKTARDSLYRLRGPDIDDTILMSISKVDTGTKIELIKSLSERNIHEGADVLLKTAKDTDRKVRIESFKSLREIASPDKLPALINLLIEVTGSSELNEAQNTVAAVACRIEEKSRRAQPVLIVLPTIQKTQSRCSLLSVLGKIGDVSSLPVLVAALKDENVDVQTATVRALSDWPTPEPLFDLLNVATNSDNQIHRILALRGFIRLLGLDDKHSYKEKVELYKKAINLAANAAEKKKVLSGLAEINSFDALQIASSYLKDEMLNREAEHAVVKIATNIYSNYPGQIKLMLNKVIQSTDNDSLRQQAQEVINHIDGLGG